MAGAQEPLGQPTANGDGEEDHQEGVASHDGVVSGPVEAIFKLRAPLKDQALDLFSVGWSKERDQVAYGEGQEATNDIPP